MDKKGELEKGVEGDGKIKLERSLEVLGGKVYTKFVPLSFHKPGGNCSSPLKLDPLTNYTLYGVVR